MYSVKHMHHLTSMTYCMLRQLLPVLHQNTRPVATGLVGRVTIRQLFWSFFKCSIKKPAHLITLLLYVIDYTTWTWQALGKHLWQQKNFY